MRCAARAMAAGGSDAGGEFGTRKNDGSLLCGWLDPAVQGCTDHSCRLNHSVVAGQHRASRRRCPGVTWACLDSGSTDIPTLYDLLAGYMPQPAEMLTATPETHDEPNATTWELNKISIRIGARNRRSKNISIQLDKNWAGGRIHHRISSVCSKPGMARPQRQKTIGAIIGFPRSLGIILTS